MKAVPIGKTLGASIEGLDLSKPLTDEEFDFAYKALAKYGVLRYPKQNLTAKQLRDFAERWAISRSTSPMRSRSPGCLRS